MAIAATLPPASAKMSATKFESLNDAHPWDVVVIGAGPAGSAAAAECAALGLTVLLVDAKAFPRPKACGGCLNRVSSRRLAELIGKDHWLWDSAVPLETIRLMHRGRSFSFAMPGGVAVERWVMDQCLVDSAVARGGVFVAETKAQIQGCEQQYRVVNLSHRQQRLRIKCRVVVLASGLGNRSALPYSTRDADHCLRSQPAANSRVGIETSLTNYPPEFYRGAIHMVVASAGYVGLTQVSGSRLHVAASVDIAALQQFGPESLVESILHEAGSPALDSQEPVNWRGTPPLSSAPNQLAKDRVFLVGDAAGYIEPFTGEGIRWALESGLGVAPYVQQACHDWSPEIGERWALWHKHHIASQQKICRWISAGLKSDSTRWMCHHLLRIRPSIATAMISRLNMDHTN